MPEVTYINIREKLSAFPSSGGALYFGRFQPFTNAHLRTVEYIAAQPFVRYLVIGIGSAQFSHLNPSLVGGPQENPFTREEREDMIKQSTIHITKPLHIIALNDLFDCTRWLNQIIEVAPPFQYVYTNSEREQSTFSKGPLQIEPIQLQFTPEEKAGPIRRMIAARDKHYRTLLPAGTLAVLDAIDAESRLERLCKQATPPLPPACASVA